MILISQKGLWRKVYREKRTWQAILQHSAYRLVSSPRLVSEYTELAISRHLVTLNTLQLENASQQLSQPSGPPLHEDREMWFGSHGCGSRRVLCSLS